VYSAGLTAAKFHASKALFKIIIGPINSGKSTACVIDIIRMAAEQRRGSDGKRRTRFLVVRNCYDDETEILTENRGWRLFKDLAESDRVAMLRNDRLEFSAPTYYYQADYVGEMVAFENEGVDFCVTPDHRMYASTLSVEAGKQVWSGYEFKTAQDIYGKINVRVKRDALWEGAPTERSPAFFEWLGFWFAEGYAGIYPRRTGGKPHYRCIISQKKDPEYVRGLFAAAGLPHR